MKFGFDKGKIITDEPLEHCSTEDDAIEIIMEDLGIDDYRIDRNTDDYSTLVYQDRDLFRIKYTTKAKWIKILMFPSMKKEYSEDPRFNTQDNKNQMFWKSNIVSLFDYKDVLQKAIDNF